MSDIVLSASVRQNLLSLQSTADLLATTQNRLATGKKVNSALDNPTNYFTAQSLDNRAGDINNLLDGIGNGVQVLQAANTGITSLQKLVDTAKSIANQALQATTGYSTKSLSSTTIAGASASNLLGNATSAQNASATGTSALSTIDLSGGGTNAVAQGSIALDTSTVAQANASVSGGTYSTDAFKSGDEITIDGATITFDGNTASGNGTAIAGSAYTGQEAVDFINDSLTTAGSTVTATWDSANDKIVLNQGGLGAGAIGNTATVQSDASNTGGMGGFSSATATNFSGGVDASGGIDVSLGDQSLTIALDGGAATTVTLSATGGSNGDGHYSADDIKTAINDALQNASVTTLAASIDSNNKLVLTSTSATKGTGDTIDIADVSSSGLSAALGLNASNAGTAGSTADLTFQVNGKTVTLAGGSSYNATAIKDAINNQVGSGASAGNEANVIASLDTNGKLVIKSTAAAGASDEVTVDTFSNGDATQLGFATAAVDAQNGSDASGGMSGLELDIASTAGGQALQITFGNDGTGKVNYDKDTGVATNVSTLDQLNTVLANNNMTASIDSNGKLTLTTTNDYASQTVGALSGTATGAGLFTAGAGSDPVADANAQNARASLVAQYNTVIDQIKTTAQDASFNGVNLLNGDQLKLVFNETGKSTLTIAGVTDDPAGLGLTALSAGTDFLDNSNTNKILSALNDASTTLRSQASSLGSNLSIVQIRQDFNKNLINVLQTGSSNLTLADTNEEAANSQALSTRQSIAVSALALANQSQQSVLQLLR